VWAVIALPVLPVFVPVAASSPRAAGSGRVRGGLLGVGAVVSAVLAHSVATSHVTAQPRGHVLDYGVDIPHLAVVIAGYLVATLGSLLVSDDRDIRALGIVLTVGAVICGGLWLEEFASTWCAFAAVASLAPPGPDRGPPFVRSSWSRHPGEPHPSRRRRPPQAATRARF